MKSKSTVYRLFIGILFIGFLFGVGWLLGKYRVGFLSFLPLTGVAIDFSQTDNSTFTVDLEKTIKRTLWNENVDRENGYFEASIEQLDQVYKDFLLSIYNRNYDGFTNVTASRLLWDVENNVITLGKSKEDLLIMQQGNEHGESYFNKYAPTRFMNSLPVNPKYYSAIRIENLKQVSTNEYLYYDKSKNITYLFKDPQELSVRRLHYICDYYYINREPTTPTASQSEDGYVDFVFENGKWKVLAQNWNYNISSGSTISSEPFTVSINANTISIDLADLSDIPKNIQANTGDVLLFKNLNGMLMSINNSEETSPWNSPLLTHSTYQISFPSKGNFEYILLDSAGNIEFEGNITIS